MVITHGGVTLSSSSMMFYNDPGHEWLKLEKGLLTMLDIADKISSCSYMRGNYAYLEKDCDAALFRDTLIEKGFEKESVKNFMNSIEDRSTDRSSKIRSYETYSNT